MATASSSWFQNWASIERSGSADASLFWSFPSGSTLYYDDEELATVADLTNPTSQSSGNGVLDFIGGSGLSNISSIPDTAQLAGLILEIKRKTVGKDALNRFVSPYSDPSSAGVSFYDNTIQLTFNGQFIGENKSNGDLWSHQNFEYKKFGSENDTWGLSGTAFTAYLLKNAGFGISISPQAIWAGLSPGAIIQSDYPPFLYGPQGGLASNGRVDQVKVTVFFIEPTQQYLDPGSIESSENLGTHSLPNTTQVYYSDYLIAKNIAKKPIPDFYQINGLEIRINKKGSDSTAGSSLKVYDETVQLYLNGNLIGDNKAKNTTLWPDVNTEGYQFSTYGSSTDLWGLSSLYASTINNPEFGVALNVRYTYENEADVDKINVDYFDIEVTYQTPATPQEIFPNTISSLEDLENPTLFKQNVQFYNQIFSPAYEVGYFDIMALSKEVNIDPHYDLAYSSINTNYLFTANNINLNYKQEGDLGKRLAGEGANPNTFKVDTRTYDLSFEIPIRIESWGYMDTVFSALYDYFIQGYKGSSTIYLGRILSDNNNPLVNVSTIKVDNIVDFLNLTTPFTAYIRSDDDAEETETITINSVNKTTKILTLASQTTKSHTPNVSYVWAKPNNPTSNREPSFSLYSLREGLFSGCVVDNISLSIQPGQTIKANVNLKFTNLDRRYQSNLLENFDNLAANVNDRKPNFLLNGTLVSIQNTSDVNSNFTLGDVKNSPLFRGFEEYLIRDFEVNSLEISFKNNLQAIYTANAKSNSYDKNFIKNLQPYAYYSNGRSISGSIKYSSPIKPWLFAEKLTGPSSLNKQDLLINFGPFKLELPEIIWTPNSSESVVENVQTKSVNFHVATEKLSYDPYFEPTGSL